MPETAVTAMQPYCTVSAPAEAEFVARRSRFLARLAPAADEERAITLLRARRAELPDASHHVYAFRRREQSACGHSDDGEPQGTAGMPLLGALIHADLQDCLLIVTRYFGGVLLGKGGLMRAYTDAAAQAIAAAPLVRMEPALLLSIDLDYAQYSRLPAIVASCGGAVLRADFAAGVTAHIRLSPDALPSLEAQVRALTSGRAQLIREGEEYIPVKL